MPKKLALSVILVLLVIALATFVYRSAMTSEPVAQNNNPFAPVGNTDPEPAAPIDLDKKYSSDRLGTAFQYPPNYDLQEYELDQNGIPGFAAVLTEQSYQGGSASEGPVTIVVASYAKPKTQDIDDWVKKNPTSYFSLSKDRKMTAIITAGAPALWYRWDGLYLSETVAIDAGDKAITATVNYLSPDDSIRSHFTKILTSFKLPGMAGKCAIPGPACQKGQLPNCQDSRWSCIESD